MYQDEEDDLERKKAVIAHLRRVVHNKKYSEEYRDEMRKLIPKLERELEETQRRYDEEAQALADELGAESEPEDLGGSDEELVRMPSKSSRSRLRGTRRK